MKPETPEKKPGRNQAGFSNLSNLRPRRGRTNTKHEPGPFQITMKKLQNLDISKSQTKAIGREEVSLMQNLIFFSKILTQQLQHFGLVSYVRNSFSHHAPLEIPPGAIVCPSL